METYKTLSREGSQILAIYLVSVFPKRFLSELQKRTGFCGHLGYGAHPNKNAFFLASRKKLVIWSYKNKNVFVIVNLILVREGLRAVLISRRIG